MLEAGLGLHSMLQLLCPTRPLPAKLLLTAYTPLLPLNMRLHGIRSPSAVPFTINPSLECSLITRLPPPPLHQIWVHCWWWTT